MAAHPTVIIDHGRVDIPEELRNDPRFRDGAWLRLVPVPSEVPGFAQASAQKSGHDFFSLKGMLANAKFDPNAELEKEKRRELAQEAHWPRS